MTESNVYELSEVIEKSIQSDTGKAHVDTTRKGLTFGFEPDQETGSTEYYLESKDLPGEKMFLSPYGWRQFWTSLCTYPLAGVDSRRISEPLIRKIALERIQNQRDMNLRAKTLFVDAIARGAGAGGKKFFRGFTTAGRSDFSTTSILQAVEKSSVGSSVSVGGMPSFPDHVFHGRFQVEDRKHKQGQPEVGFVLVTSEVNAAHTTLDACLSIPECSAHMIVQPMNVPLFKLAAVHKDLSAVTEVVEKALTRINDLKPEIRDHIQRSREEVINKTETAAPRYLSRFGLPRETLGAIQKEFNTMVGTGAATPTRWGLAVAAARVGRRHAEAVYGNAEKRVVLETVAGSLIQTKVS